MKNKWLIWNRYFVNEWMNYQLVINQINWNQHTRSIHTSFRLECAWTLVLDRFIKSIKISPIERGHGETFLASNKVFLLKKCISGGNIFGVEMRPLERKLQYPTVHAFSRFLRFDTATTFWGNSPIDAHYHQLIKEHSFVNRLARVLLIHKWKRLNTDTHQHNDRNPLQPKHTGTPH